MNTRHEKNPSQSERSLVASQGLSPAAYGPPPELRRSVVPCSYSPVTFASLGYPSRICITQRPHDHFVVVAFSFVRS